MDQLNQFLAVQVRRPSRVTNILQECLRPRLDDQGIEALLLAGTVVFFPLHP
jgi:hypothetical protein